MSKRESGILTVSHRCSSLHLLFSSVAINFPGSLRAYNSSSVGVCGNCNVFVAKKLYPQEKVLLPIQNCAFVSSIRKNELTRDTDAQPLCRAKSASLGAICVVVSSHCELLLSSFSEISQHAVYRSILKAFSLALLLVELLCRLVCPPVCFLPVDGEREEITKWA